MEKIHLFTTDETRTRTESPAYSGHQVRPVEPYVQSMKDAVVDWMKRNSEMPDEILSRIYDMASATPNGDLLLAICKVESNFNPNIRSQRDALGLMGVRPGV
jgi:hypothetical protein